MLQLSDVAVTPDSSTMAGVPEPLCCTCTVLFGSFTNVPGAWILRPSSQIHKIWAAICRPSTEAIIAITVSKATPLKSLSIDLPHLRHSEQSLSMLLIINRPCGLDLGE